MRKIVLAALIAFIIGTLAGYRTGSAVSQARHDRYLAQQARQENARLAEVMENNRTLHHEISRLQATREKENKDAQEKYHALLARIARGDTRLSIPVRTAGGLSCSGRAADAAGKTDAGLDPETARRILSVGHDGDAAIRELNQCIDQYRAVREQFETLHSPKRPGDRGEKASGDAKPETAASQTAAQHT